MQHVSFPSDDAGQDFATLLEQSFEEYESVGRGDLVTATILAVDTQGLILDVGLKRDAVVPRSDLDAVGRRDFEVGEQITVMIVQTEDNEGNLVASIRQAIASRDWDKATTIMESGELYQGYIAAANRGGLIVPFGELRGFVPASHVVDLPRGLGDDERVQALKRFVGQTLGLKIIEVNAQRRRLVLSQREAEREARDAAKGKIMDALSEGDVVQGVVSSLRDFGAFVDIGGADGLIHISELAWRRVRHPNEVLAVGDKIDTYVLQLDHDEKRIGLSLKRLEPNPWENIEEIYTVGQAVEGTVSRLVSFGAFVELEDGIEALLHLSQMGDPAPSAPEDVIRAGEIIDAQIISLEPDRQRIGLSLTGVKDIHQTESEDEAESETLPAESLA